MGEPLQGFRQGWSLFGATSYIKGYILKVFSFQLLKIKTVLKLIDLFLLRIAVADSKVACWYKLHKNGLTETAPGRIAIGLNESRFSQIGPAIIANDYASTVNDLRRFELIQNGQPGRAAGFAVILGKFLRVGGTNPPAVAVVGGIRIV